MLGAKATGLRQQMSTFYPQTLSTETNINVIASMCAYNMEIRCRLCWF